MPAKAKKITLYLGNGTLDGLVNISESDGWDLGGELFSCPRDNLKDLIEDDTIDLPAPALVAAGADPGPVKPRPVDERRKAPFTERQARPYPTGCRLLLGVICQLRC